MIPNHAQFLNAIAERNLIRIEFYSKPDMGVIDRECAPLDYGPEAGVEGGQNRYWIWDYADSTGANPLGLVPEQIVSVQVMGKSFVPHELRLGPRKWFIPREWRIFPEEIVPAVSIESPKKSE
jgi:hypothetical protein